MPCTEPFTEHGARTWALWNPHTTAWLRSSTLKRWKVSPCENRLCLTGPISILLKLKTPPTTATRHMGHRCTSKCCSTYWQQAWNCCQGEETWLAPNRIYGSSECDICPPRHQQHSFASTSWFVPNERAASWTFAPSAPLDCFHSRLCISRQSTKSLCRNQLKSSRIHPNSRQQRSCVFRGVCCIF